ncbi:MAG: DNA-processing protein DprA [Bacilli bacterium]|nr:DNA-processing protein DprA [Bacilli bacterium]
MDGREALIYTAVKENGDWDKILMAMRRRECPDYEEAMATLKQLKCKVVTMFDAEYPQQLRHVYKPPFVLFYYGDISLVKKMERCIAYVGSRDMTPYGENMARKIVGDLAYDGFTVVSGLARGIDAIAGEVAVKRRKAVAVLGNGIDYCFPPSNSALQREIKRKGLLISEYPGLTPPIPQQFPLRNRIVAGLSCCVVVGQASKRSGTLITVGYALNHGRDVCCVPFPADQESSCNDLIKEGAPLVEDAADIYRLIGYEKDSPPEEEKNFSDSL